MRAAVDPTLNAVRRALLGAMRSLRPGIGVQRATLVARAVAEGPAVLTPRERDVLLRDPRCVDDLHRRVWAEGDREQRRWSP